MHKRQHRYVALFHANLSRIAYNDINTTAVLYLPAINMNYMIEILVAFDSFLTTSLSRTPPHISQIILINFFISYFYS